MFDWRFGLSARLVGGKLEQSWDYSPSHQSPACSQCVSQSAQASGPRIHQRGQAWHPEKWAQPSTCQDRSEPNVTDSLSMRDMHSKGITEIENAYPYRIFFYFCWNSGSWSPMIWHLGITIVRNCCSLSFTLIYTLIQVVTIWRGESSGWKWLMPLFVHPGIWSSSAPLGPGQICYPLQGLNCPSPSLLRLQVRFPSLQPAPPSPQKTPRVAQSGPTSELSTFSGDDIYDVEMDCYLFSIQRDHSHPDSPLSLSPAIFFHSSLLLCI